MSASRLIGILLVVVGVIGLVFTGITFTRSEEVLEVGPLEVTAKEKERIPIPPVVAGIALVGGTVLIMKGRRRKYG
jgi:hypothetical protein